jgi:GT2 family glycosyltransferase
LEALQVQTVSGFRTIIVDNGDANHGQLERAESYQNTTYIKSESNLGFAAGNNCGLDNVGDAEWVMLLNPDTVPAPDWMEKMLAATVQYPDFSFFGARLLQAQNPALLDGDGDCYHVSGLPWRSGMGLPAAQASATPRETFAPCAAAALYRSSALREVGGFDEDFFCYMEDVDLGFRLRLVGHRCLTVPDAKVLHVGSATTGKRSPFYIYHGQRNLFWAYVKNMPGVLFWLFLPLHVALNIVGVLRYALSGQLGIVWRAKHDAIKALPKIWKKRREIQKARVASLSSILKILDKRPVPGLDRAMNSLWK